LTFVPGRQEWQPLTREEFRALKKGDRLRDRQGVGWTVHADTYLDQRDREYRIVLTSGPHARTERERFHDSYMRLPAA
jgi:hypothetical protein